jgi:hypothetical protein
VTDCACLEGSWVLPFTDAGPPAQWFASVSVGCGGNAEITLNCTDNGDGTVTLSVQVTCGADNISVTPNEITIPYEDLDTLDETFTVEMINLAGDSCGDCTYTWDSMAGSYVLDTDNCDPGPDGCGSTVCGDPPVSYEGDTVVVPCTGTPTIPCCVGSFSLRIMR